MNLKVTKIASFITTAFVALTILIAWTLNQPAEFIMAVPLAALTCVATYSLSAYLIERQFKNQTGREQPSIAPILLLSSTKIIIIASLFLVFITALHIDILGLIFGVTAFYVALTLTSLFAGKDQSDVLTPENSN